MSTLTVVRHGQARPFDSNPDQLSALGEEQARTLAGKRVAAIPDSLDDRLVIVNSGSTSREDLLLQMQLMAAYVTDPGYRTDDWAQLMRQADDRDAGNFSTPGAALVKAAVRLLHGIAEDPLLSLRQRAEARRALPRFLATLDEENS